MTFKVWIIACRDGVSSHVLDFESRKLADAAFDAVAAADEDDNYCELEAIKLYAPDPFPPGWDKQ